MILISRTIPGWVKLRVKNLNAALSPQSDCLTLDSEMSNVERHSVGSL
jgi:hypothetical protein